MNVFEAVKPNISTRQAAEMYGIKVNRNGMAVCPFHNGEIADKGETHKGLLCASVQRMGKRLERECEQTHSSVRSKGNRHWQAHAQGDQADRALDERLSASHIMRFFCENGSSCPRARTGDCRAAFFLKSGHLKLQFTGEEKFLLVFWYNR